MSKGKANILLVDDSIADQVTVEQALEYGYININLMIAGNGVEALKILRNEPPYDDGEQFMRPNLILMDINMPVMDGKETLRCIRDDTSLCDIPVVVFTTSSREQDVVECYALGANAYIKKPVSAIDFVDVMQHLERFWFDVAILPLATQIPRGI